MSVLGALTSLLALDTKAPVTNQTGGTSVGNPDAGSERSPYNQLSPVTTGDRAGAGILTVVAITFASASLWWMVK